MAAQEGRQACVCVVEVFMPCDLSLGRLDDAVCLVDLVTWSWWCEDGRLDGSSGGSQRPSLSESSGSEDGLLE